MQQLAAPSGARLDLRPGLADRLAWAFLLAHREGNTRDAYRRDLADWWRWCAGQDLDPSRPAGSTSTPTPAASNSRAAPPPPSAAAWRAAREVTPKRVAAGHRLQAASRASDAVTIGLRQLTAPLSAR